MQGGPPVSQLGSSFSMDTYPGNELHQEQPFGIIVIEQQQLPLVLGSQQMSRPPLRWQNRSNHQQQERASVENKSSNKEELGDLSYSIEDDQPSKRIKKQEEKLCKIMEKSFKKRCAKCKKDFCPISVYDRQCPHCVFSQEIYKDAQIAKLKKRVLQLEQSLARSKAQFQTFLNYKVYCRQCQELVGFSPSQAVCDFPINLPAVSICSACKPSVDSLILAMKKVSLKEQQEEKQHANSKDDVQSVYSLGLEGYRDRSNQGPRQRGPRLGKRENPQPPNYLGVLKEEPSEDEQGSPEFKQEEPQPLSSPTHSGVSMNSQEQRLIQPKNEAEVRMLDKSFIALSSQEEEQESLGQRPAFRPAHAEQSVNPCSRDQPEHIPNQEPSRPEKNMFSSREVTSSSQLQATSSPPADLVSSQAQESEQASLQDNIYQPGPSSFCNQLDNLQIEVPTKNNPSHSLSQSRGNPSSSQPNPQPPEGHEDDLLLNSLIESYKSVPSAASNPPANQDQAAEEQSGVDNPTFSMSEENIKQGPEKSDRALQQQSSNSESRNEEDSILSFRIQKHYPDSQFVPSQGEFSQPASLLARPEMWLNKMELASSKYAPSNDYDESMESCLPAKDQAILKKTSVWFESRIDDQMVNATNFHLFKNDEVRIKILNFKNKKYTRDDLEGPITMEQSKDAFLRKFRKNLNHWKNLLLNEKIKKWEKSRLSQQP